MNHQADPLSELVFELAKLPGIGERTANRLAHYIVRQDEPSVRKLSQSIMKAREDLKLCEMCFCFTQETLCALCRSPNRDGSQICVVEKPSDILSIDATGSYRGRFHVLHGLISPLDGMNPEQLKIAELLARSQPGMDEMDSPPVREVILALNSTVEGESTALYVSKRLRAMNIKVTQLAHGMPAGGYLEFTDRKTLARALEHRTELK